MHATGVSGVARYVAFLECVSWVLGLRATPPCSWRVARYTGIPCTNNNQLGIRSHFKSAFPAQTKCHTPGVFGDVYPSCTQHARWMRPAMRHCLPRPPPPKRRGSYLEHWGADAGPELPSSPQFPALLRRQDLFGVHDARSEDVVSSTVHLVGVGWGGVGEVELQQLRSGKAGKRW